MTLKETEKLVQFHMERVGLKGYKFEWLQKRSNFRRAGQCNYRDKTIKLQPVFAQLNSVERVTNTILHEIAHGIMGPKHGHNKFWKRKAIEIGCDGQRCYDVNLVIKGNVKRN